jgi:hypothetical protein
MLAEARFQLYSAGVLRGRDRFPEGFAGCDHWLWPHAPLAAVPRVNGERIVLVGPPAYRTTWDVSRRFPAMPAELRLWDTLPTSAVRDLLASLAGRPVVLAPPTELPPARVPARAA